MQTIDAHVHLWMYNEVKDAWITNEMNVLKRNFLPADLLQRFKENNIDGCIAVQADESENETEFLLQLSKENEWIKAVVGWVDFDDEHINEKLERYSEQKTLKGFRHILQSKNINEYIENKVFLNAVTLLEKYNFSYDVLVYHNQLKNIGSFLKKFPQQRFVIDHLGKPNIKDQLQDEWKKDICEIAKQENVYCKISGLVTQTTWQNWNESELDNYISTAVECFGINRLMFGSDWPVCLLASSYKRWKDYVSDYFNAFSSSEKEKIFGSNAIEFYKAGND